MLFLFSSGLFFGQDNLLGVSINWDSEVGCQLYTMDEVRDRKGLMLEQIIDGKCIKACASSTVSYSLDVFSNNNYATVWGVFGGTITNQSNNTCTVIWGAAGSGELNFTVSSVLVKL